MFRFALSVMRLRHGHQSIYLVIEVIWPGAQFLFQDFDVRATQSGLIHSALPTGLTPSLEVLIVPLTFCLSETQQLDDMGLAETGAGGAAGSVDVPHAGSEPGVDRRVAA